MALGWGRGAAEAKGRVKADLGLQSGNKEVKEPVRLEEGGETWQPNQHPLSLRSLHGGAVPALHCSPCSALWSLGWEDEGNQTGDGEDISALSLYQSAGCKSSSSLGLAGRGEAQGCIHRNGLFRVKDPVPFSSAQSRADDNHYLLRLCLEHALDSVQRP